MLVAGFLACRENPADVASTGNLALELSVAEGVSLANVDAVRVRLSSAGAADINFTLTSTGTNQYEGTRANLAPGTYTVTIRGMAGSEVEFFGETSATVQVGTNASVSITLTSFIAAIDPIPNTTSVNFTATWPAVTGAESYDVYASSDPTFQTSIDPDLITDAGGTFTADFTVPGVGAYVVHVRAVRSGIETGALGIQTANVFTSEVVTGDVLSATIATSTDTQLYGVQVPAGDGMLVLAFRTGSGNTLDLDVTIGPVNGARVGGNNNLGVGTNDRFEWLAAYERISPNPSGLRSGTSRTASRIFSPVFPTRTLTPSKGTATSDPTAALAELRSLVQPTVLAKTAPAGTQPPEDQRNIEVLGANGTTGDYTLWYQTCRAFEIAIGQSGSDSLTTSDCLTFNFLADSLTYGAHWAFDAGAGDTLDLRLNSTEIDPVLYLFGPNGALVAGNDDFDALNSRIVTVAPSDGMYIAFPASFDRLAVGAYTLSINLFVPATADPATSTIGANPTTIPPDGVSTSTITVTLRDSSGNRLAFGGDGVTLATTVGVLGLVTDNDDGSYETTLTAGTAVGTAVITGTVNGAAILDTATVYFTAVSPATSTIAAGAQSITGNGTSTTTITVQLKDSASTNLTLGGDSIALTTSSGTLSAVTDNANGTYTATLTSSISGDSTAIVTGTVYGADITDSAFVDFTRPGDLLVDGSFSHGDSAWTTTTATAAPSRTITDPLTPPGLAVLGADSTGAGVDSDSGSILQTVTIPTGSNARLTLWWKVVTDEDSTTTFTFDEMVVTMRNLAETQTFLLRRADTVCGCTLSNKDADIVYTSTFWDLAAMAGDTWTLRIAYTADFNNPTLFRVDNVSIAPPVPAPPSPAGEGATVRTEAGTLTRIEGELTLVPDQNDRRKPER